MSGQTEIDVKPIRDVALIDRLTHSPSTGLSEIHLNFNGYRELWTSTTNSFTLAAVIGGQTLQFHKDGRLFVGHGAFIKLKHVGDYDLSNRTIRIGK